MKKLLTKKKARKLRGKEMKATFEFQAKSDWLSLARLKAK